MDTAFSSARNQNPEAALRYKAIGLLARREQSRNELHRKLQVKADEEGWRVDIDALLEDLIRLGLQSDLRFSEVLVRSKANDGYGPIRVYQFGLQYGLNSELIRQQLEKQNFDWFERALKQKRKHCGFAIAIDAKERSKQVRYLYQRGFSRDHISYAISVDPDQP